MIFLMVFIVLGLFFDFWVFFERISISVSKSWISDLVILNLSLSVKN
ncbi:TPA: hypothetical protein SB586_001685 [Campylobacter jejuni]|nr:hypothetical protein [Campylobacter jejuni]